MGISTFKGWIPIHRLPVLTNLHGGAAKFCTLLAGRRWSILLIRHDPTMPAVPAGQRPILKEAIVDADVDRIANEIIREHRAHYHPGRTCRGNQYGACADRFGDRNPDDPLPDVP